jgi:membrane-anchored protein YejM (alkaline phosphatase superfamily)
MNFTKIFYQPLDQFDLYFLNNINHQPYFSIFFQNFFFKFNINEIFFLNLTIYLLILFTLIFLFTSKILMKRLKLISSTI